MRTTNDNNASTQTRTPQPAATRDLRPHDQLEPAQAKAVFEHPVAHLASLGIRAVLVPSPAPSRRAA